MIPLDMIPPEMIVLITVCALGFLGFVWAIVISKSEGQRLSAIVLMVVCMTGLCIAIGGVAFSNIYEPTITVCNIKTDGVYTHALDLNSGEVYYTDDLKLGLHLIDGHTYKIVTIIGLYSNNKIIKITSSDFLCNDVDNKAMGC